MSATAAFAEDIIRLIFTASAVANIADNAATAPATTLYVSLHTGDPGESGTQQTSECAYVGYARVGVSRSGSGWTVTADSVANTAEVLFGTCTSGSETATHAGIGLDASGAGTLLVSDVLTTPFAISTDIQPRFSAGQLVINLD